MFPPRAIFIIGDAKTQQSNPITLQYGQFFLGFVVDRDSGDILSCGASTTLAVTNEFVQSLFYGKSLRMDSNILREEIESRYFGASQKALLVAFKDAQKKFFNIKSGLKESDDE